MYILFVLFCFRYDWSSGNQTREQTRYASFKSANDTKQVAIKENPLQMLQDLTYLWGSARIDVTAFSANSLNTIQNAYTTTVRLLNVLL